MQLRLTADAPSIDTDLYARYEADVDLVVGELVTDHSAESDSGNELLTVDSGSQPPLRAGTYYVSVGLFTRNTPASGTISVVFERDVAPPAPPPSTSGQTLESGRAAQFTLPATAAPTLYFGDFSYRFNVPSASGRLQVVMKAADPAIDVDLYLRFGADIALDGSTVVADFRAQGDTGDETLSVASPNLRAGTYFIGFGLFTPNREAKGTITATFTPGSQPTGGLLKEYDLTVEPAAAPELELEAKPGRGSIAAIGSKSPELLKQRSKRGLVGSSKSEVTAK